MRYIKVLVILMACVCGPLFAEELDSISKIMTHAIQPNKHVKRFYNRPVPIQNPTLNNFCQRELKYTQQKTESPHEKESFCTFVVEETIEEVPEVEESISVPERIKDTLPVAVNGVGDGDGLFDIEEPSADPEIYCEYKGRTLKEGASFQKSGSLCECKKGKITCEKYKYAPPSASLSESMARAAVQKKDTFGCSIGGSLSSQNSFWLFLFPLFILAFRTKKSWGLVLLMTLGTLIGCKPSQNAKMQSAVQKFTPFELRSVNFVLYKKDKQADDSLFQVLFIEGLQATGTPLSTKPNGEKGRTPLPAGLSMNKKEYQLLKKFMEGGELSTNEKQLLFNNPNFAVYKATIDGLPIVAQTVIDSGAALGRGVAVHFRIPSHAGDGLVIGKYTTKAYHHFKHQVFNNIEKIDEVQKKKLLGERFIKLEQRALMDFETMIDWTLEIPELDLLFDTAESELKEKGFMSQFTINVDTGDPLKFAGTFDKNEQGRSRGFSNWSEIFAPFEELKRDLKLPKDEKSFKVEEKKERLYQSLYLCQFDPVSLETTADICKITAFKKENLNEPGEISMITLPENQGKTALAGIPHIAISSAHSMDAIKTAGNLWSFIVKRKSPAPTIEHFPWKNTEGMMVENDNNNGNDNNNYNKFDDPNNPLSEKFYSYPTRLFLKEQNPATCVDYTSYLNQPLTYNLETGGCMNRLLCKQMGLYDLHLERYYNSYAAELIGQQVEDELVKQRIQSLFEGVLPAADLDPHIFTKDFPVVICTPPPGQSNIDESKALKCPTDLVNVLPTFGSSSKEIKCSDWYSCHTVHEGYVISLDVLGAGTKDVMKSYFKSEEIERLKGIHGADFVKGQLVCIAKEAAFYNEYQSLGLSKKDFESRTGIKRHVTPAMKEQE